MPEADCTRRPLNHCLKRWFGGCLALMLLLVSISGCATTAAPDPAAVPIASGSAPPEQVLRAEVRSWMGTPHRMGGMNRRGIDCSGLVVVLYEELFDMRLPRTTSALMRKGRPVASNNLTAGDLVFFKPKAKNHHVGIYLGRGEFVHASTSSGVTISRLDTDFWRGCYLTSRRLR